MERLYRKAEALELLRVSRPTLDRLIARGDLTTVRLSARAVRIAESAISDLIRRGSEEHRRGSQRGPGGAMNAQ